MRPKKGQALIEFALILPLMLLLIVNVVNFGGFLYAWISVGNSARTGAQCMVRGGATPGSPAPPALTVVQTLVLDDLHPLPNSTSAQVKVCVRSPSSSSTAVSCTPGPPAFTPPIDSSPEAVRYIMGSVDVVYTYLPFIPFFDFSGLGIRATLPPLTIHRQAAMRVLQ